MVLRVEVESFKKGNERERELTMVAGATVITASAQICTRDGVPLFKVNGQAREKTWKRLASWPRMWPNLSVRHSSGSGETARAACTSWPIEPRQPSVT